jgi:hypothetical protein
MKRAALAVAFLVAASLAAMANNLPDASNYIKKNGLPVCNTVLECFNGGFQSGFDVGFQSGFQSGFNAGFAAASK